MTQQGMNGSIFIPVLAISLAVLCFSQQSVAADPAFAENEDEIVQQMLGGEKRYAKTRSFVIPKTRAITVRAKNKKGNEETMVVEVPENSLDDAARLKIEFDVNSAALRDSAIPLLGELGRALHNEKVAGNTVCIKGHTDSDGEDDYNLQLSYDRADSVVDYLQKHAGVSGSWLKVFGYGESVPLVANSSHENKQKNRRVEIALNCPELSSIK